MKKTIAHLIRDLDRMSAVVREVEEELVTTKPSSFTTRKIMTIKEKLGEIHARLDGVREFVVLCQRKAEVETVPEEMDVWL